MAKEKEKKLCVCRKHWTAYIIPVTLVIICVITAFVGLGNDGAEGAAPAGALLGFAVLIAICVLIDYKSEYIAITETKLIGHRGFIKSKTLSTPLSKVQSVGLSNGLLGKVFKYHTITVDNAGTGTTEFVFKRMANAQEFVDKVNERI